MNRVLFAGDAHRNLDYALGVLDLAHRSEADKVLFAGDFAYVHDDRSKRYLAAVNDTARRHDIQSFFIDGNHDDHDWLATLSPTPFAPVDTNLTYIRRGARWTWCARTFLALGGGYSIDQQWRRANGHAWWPAETMTDAEIDAIDLSPVDVLVTHDAPASAPVADLLDGYHVIPAAEEHRRRLERVCLATQPNLVVHGHYHYRYDRTIDGCRYVGLGADRRLYDATFTLDAVHDAATVPVQ